jgi:hypothetical protein
MNLVFKWLAAHPPSGNKSLSSTTPRSRVKATALEAARQLAKVFWFFFSKKNCFSYAFLSRLSVLRW